MPFPAAREWVYLAGEPHALAAGPIKIGWSGRLDPYQRVEEHARIFRDIELIIAYELPPPFAWAVEQDVHRALWRNSMRGGRGKEWYRLGADRCLAEVDGVIAELRRSPRRIPIARVVGPGWRRIRL